MHGSHLRSRHVCPGQPSASAPAHTCSPRGPKQSTHASVIGPLRHDGTSLEGCPGARGSWQAQVTVTVTALIPHGRKGGDCLPPLQAQDPALCVLQ